MSSYDMMVRSEYGKESVFFSSVLQARWIHRMHSFASIKDEFTVKEKHDYQVGSIFGGQLTIGDESSKGSFG